MEQNSQELGTALGLLGGASMDELLLTKKMPWKESGCGHLEGTHTNRPTIIPEHPTSKGLWCVPLGVRVDRESHGIPERAGPSWSQDHVELATGVSEEPTMHLIWTQLLCVCHIGGCGGQ